MNSTETPRFSSGYIAHEVVLRHQRGETITPATIKAELMEQGATERQATSLTKIVTALVPTVTTASMRKHIANKGA
jgi:hypothetical protein